MCALCWNWSPEGLTMLNGLITFCPGFHRSVEDALEHTGGRARPGLCSYGQTTSCCLGWRNVNGICQRKSFSNSVTARLRWHIAHSSQVISSASQQNNKYSEISVRKFRFLHFWLFSLHFSSYSICLFFYTNISTLESLVLESKFIQILHLSTVLGYLCFTYCMYFHFMLLFRRKLNIFYSTTLIWQL